LRGLTGKAARIVERGRDSVRPETAPPPAKSNSGDA
jgi:hypothetical protein